MEAVAWMDHGLLDGLVVRVLCAQREPDAYAYETLRGV